MKPTVDDARQSMVAHAAQKGLEIRQKHGPEIDWNTLLRILEDRTCVRYPCDIVFDQRQLQPGEFAYAFPKGANPEDGFTIYIHPHFQTQLHKAPLLVLYHLVSVNYGPFASAEDAESLGAAALGVPRDDYYQAICRMADEVTDR